jgi:hypothetical protein
MEQKFEADSFEGAWAIVGKLQFPQHPIRVDVVWLADKPSCENTSTVYDDELKLRTDLDLVFNDAEEIVKEPVRVEIYGEPRPEIPREVSHEPVYVYEISVLPPARPS